MIRTKACSLLLATLALGCATKSTEPERTVKSDGRLAAAELREECEANLRQIGQAYLQALATAPPRSADDLKTHLENIEKLLVSPRDQQPYEIVWGVDPVRLADPATETLLAWEKTADAERSRCVLLADCKSVVYMNEELFRMTTKAKGR